MAHVVMEGRVLHTMKVSLKEYCMYVIHGLSSCLELGVILIEICVDLVDVPVLLDSILCETTEVCSKGRNGCVTIERGKSHDRFVHERGYNLRLSIHHHFIILFVGKQGCFGLLGEAVVEAVPYLFTVLC